ncbi:DUF5667 domain-containing protein [Chloroflexota bacterium]
MKKVEEVLIQCIDDIKAGRASLKDCLDRYPDVRRELEQLLSVALSINEPADIRPSNAFKVRARVNLMEHIHADQEGKRAVKSPSQAGGKHGWYAGWARAVAVIVVVILLVSGAGTGTAFASQASLPGDALYSVKIGTEQLQRIITFDDAAEVDLELKFASTRLDELEELVNMPADQTVMTNVSYDKILTLSIINILLNEPKKTYISRADRIAIAVAGYETNLNSAITKAEQIKDGETSLETVSLAILNHLNRLDGIKDRASEGAREVVNVYKEIAINGHISALKILAKVNPVRATEINRQAVQDRLDRAEAEAAKGNRKGDEDALHELEILRQFGEDILSSARGTSQDSRAVEETKGPAQAEQQDTADSNHSQASQESNKAIEQPDHEQDMQGQQQQDEQSNIPTEFPVPGNIPHGDSKNTSQPGPNKPENGRR